MKPESMSKFDVLKAEINFHVEWGVWPSHDSGSICYTTNKLRAELVAEALAMFVNSDKGREWIEANLEKPDSK